MSSAKFGIFRSRRTSFQTGQSRRKVPRLSSRRRRRRKSWYGLSTPMSRCAMQDRLITNACWLEAATARASERERLAEFAAAVRYKHSWGDYAEIEHLSYDQLRAMQKASYGLPPRSIRGLPIMAQRGLASIALGALMLASFLSSFPLPPTIILALTLTSLLALFACLSLLLVRVGTRWVGGLVRRTMLWPIWARSWRADRSSNLSCSVSTMRTGSSAG